MVELYAKAKVFDLNEVRIRFGERRYPSSGILARHRSLEEIISPEAWVSQSDATIAMLPMKWSRESGGTLHTVYAVLRSDLHVKLDGVHLASPVVQGGAALMAAVEGLLLTSG